MDELTVNIAKECSEFEAGGTSARMSVAEPDCLNCIHYDDGYCKIFQREKVASAGYARDSE